MCDQNVLEFCNFIYHEHRCMAMSFILYNLFFTEHLLRADFELHMIPLRTHMRKQRTHVRKEKWKD